MNAVIYYSNTGESKRIAEYCAEQLNYTYIDIFKAEHSYGNVVLVFPIHCQNIPQIVKNYLKNLEVANLSIIATYGKMCHGNVLNEIQQKYQHNIIAAAYVPTKHAYLSEPQFCDFEKLRPIIDKASKPSTIKIPKSYKNPFANSFKSLRSRIGIKILKNDNCNHCNICRLNCPMQAIINGKPDRKCIRCLKCIAVCPNHALTFKTSAVMSAYLKKKKQDELIIYI